MTDQSESGDALPSGEDEQLYPENLDIGDCIELLGCEYKITHKFRSAVQIEHTDNSDITAELTRNLLDGTINLKFNFEEEELEEILSMKGNRGVDGVEQ